MNSRERSVVAFLIVVLLAGIVVSTVKRAQQRRRLEAIALAVVAESVSSPTTAAAKSSPGSTADAAGRLDLNTATVAELDLLPGIGPALAQRIVEYRVANNGFRDRTELLKVSGIGPKRFSAVKERVTVRR